MRESIETLKDKILLLYLLSKIKEYGEMSGNLKLQKIVFLSENELMNTGIKGFHFKFFRYNIGPFSKELMIDYNDLNADGFVSSYFTLKSRAEDLLDYIIDPLKEIQNNQNTFGIIDKICKTYGSYSGLKLTNIVYDMVIEPYDLQKEMKIKDIPPFIDILVPECFDAEIKFEIPNLLLEDIKREFVIGEISDKESIKIIDKAENRLINAIRNKIKPSEKVEFIKKMKSDGISPELIKKFSSSQTTS